VVVSRALGVGGKWRRAVEREAQISHTVLLVLSS